MCQNSGAHVPDPAVWFLAIRAGTGADVFTDRLCEGLSNCGIRSEITWLPHHAEYIPWAVSIPDPPAWANIAHVNTWLSSRFVPRTLPVLATMHHSVHDSALNAYKSAAQVAYHRAWIKPLERKMLRRASAIVAVSNYTARRTREAFAVEGINVVYNGIELDRYPDTRRPYPGQPFRLLYVGSWSTRKGVDMLLPIMESLGKGFELCFTASPREGPGVNSLPLNCRSIGRPDERSLIDAYATSDALLLPSRLEGFGQVAVEAMACGTPVIATNGSALVEVVEDNVTGLLCRRDDVRDFADAARRLAGNPNLWRRMSRAARLSVQRRFGAVTMVNQYVKLYRSLL